MKSLVPRLRTLLLTISLASCCAIADTPKELSLSSGKKETITLQYRTAHDAVAPSRFVIAGGVAPPGLTIQWNLSRPHNRKELKIQEKQKEQFYKLIDMIEVKQINGVEFECAGEINGFELSATTIPHLTEAGRHQIDNAPPAAGPEIWHGTKQ